MKTKKQAIDNSPILMKEEFWANSQFSIARYYGGLKAFGHEYWIVDKQGRDIFECSAIADREGREMAIEPGEPCDLVRQDFRNVYRDLGRDRFLELLDLNRLHSDREILNAMKAEVKNMKKK